MGLILGSFALLISLIFLLFPKILSKIFHVGKTGLSFSKKEGKWSVGLAPSLSESVGEDKSILIMRSIGIVLLILTVFAFLDATMP